MLWEMSRKFLKIGYNFYDPEYVKKICCGGIRRGCGVIITNGVTKGKMLERDVVNTFVCDSLSECPIRNQDIWRFHGE